MDHTKHNLFKPKTMTEGKEHTVGHCNGIPAEERWKEETPIFAKEICKLIPQGGKVLDYGCGVGRLSKEILKQRPDVTVVGVDASQTMLDRAVEYVSDSERFIPSLPLKLREVNLKFDVVYCVYVLQHCPAIEIRNVLERISYNLKDDGHFVYCSSDYRMAIRFDGAGFFDDRFLGVDLQKEISRFFNKLSDLFDDETLNSNKVVKAMISGTDLPHPAFIYKKKAWSSSFMPFDYDVTEEVKDSVPVIKSVDSSIKLGVDKINTNKLLLINRLAPGDILVMTNAIRDLYASYPHYKIEVRTPCNEIFDNNPAISKLNYNEEKYNKINNWFQSNDPKFMDNFHRVAMLDDIAVIDMHYPSINYCGTSGKHFCEGHRRFLESMLDIRIPQTEIRPQIFLSKTEREWLSPVAVKKGYSGKYWVINAGSKGDYTLKQYHQYQEVVNLLKDEITFVQTGQIGHNHQVLDNVIDMRGQTSLREFFRLVNKAEGVITCVSFPMHAAAAFTKPCVVVAGGREPWRWEAYPGAQFIYLNGALSCAPYDGCWKSQHSDCINMTEGGVPKCMRLITPEMIVERVMLYYDGGILKRERKAEVANV